LQALWQLKLRRFSRYCLRALRALVSSADPLRPRYQISITSAPSLTWIGMLRSRSVEIK
jgi:hypothetical protein